MVSSTPKGPWTSPRVIHTFEPGPYPLSKPKGSCTGPKGQEPAQRVMSWPKGSWTNPKGHEPIQRVMSPAAQRVMSWVMSQLSKGSWAAAQRVMSRLSKGSWAGFQRVLSQAQRIMSWPKGLWTDPKGHELLGHEPAVQGSWAGPKDHELALRVVNWSKGS